MKFTPSNEMKINVLEEQKSFLSSEERMNRALKRNKNVIAFDILNDEKVIGFAMLRQFKKARFFLWNFAIDKNFQNQGLGTKAFKELIEFMKTEHQCVELTTTYTWGNNVAKHLYENVGFKQTSVVEEDNIHEVNMSLEI